MIGRGGAGRGRRFVAAALALRGEPLPRQHAPAPAALLQPGAARSRHIGTAAGRTHRFQLRGVVESAAVDNTFFPGQLAIGQ